MEGTTIFLIFLGIAIAVSISVIIFLNSRKKEDLPKNLPFVINYLPAYTDGHAIAFELEAKLHPSGNYVCIIAPLDVYVDENNVVHGNELQQICIAKERRIEHSRGTWGSRRTIVEYLPRTEMDYPPSVVDSFIGTKRRAASTSTQSWIQHMEEQHQKDANNAYLSRKHAGQSLSSDVVEEIKEAKAAIQQQQNPSFARLPQREEEKK